MPNITQKNFFQETEIPGSQVHKDDNYPIICHRYFFAGERCARKKVLEVGCGPGIGLGYLSAKSRFISGGDITSASLKLAREHYGDRVSLIRMDAHALPFQNASYDVVTSLAAIIYYDLPVFLKECRRIIKKNGMLILNTPNPDQPGFRKSNLSNKYYSVPELLSLLENLDFQPEFFGAFPASPPPASAPPPRKPQPAIAHPFSLIPPSLTKTFGKLLTQMPGGQAVKDLLIDLFFHRMTLKPELTEADIEKVKNIQTTPIPSDQPDTRHRIVYVTAVKK